MIKQIINYFTKNSRNIPEDIVEHNSLDIIMDSPDPMLKIVVVDTSENEAKRFANMLYDLHQGDHINTIIRILADMAQNDTTIRSFVGLVLVEWSAKYKNNTIPRNVQNYQANIDNEPAIKPTHFFKFMRNE